MNDENPSESTDSRPLALADSLGHVLIIDDDPGVRSVLKRSLEKAGYSCSEAENGNEGLKKLGGKPVDLVILDMLMPEKEGAETLREIRATWPVVPLFAISGGGAISADDCLRIARALGADKVFRKPFDLKDMVASVQSALA